MVSGRRTGRRPPGGHAAPGATSPTHTPATTPTTGVSSNYIQGVYCQEVFHTYGFDHSDTGDCMGLGYFASGTDYYGPHNNTDFYNRYRFH